MINRVLLATNEMDFRYLYKLQQSGRVNMFGAGEFLQRERGLDKQKAKEVLLHWMEQYELIAAELGIDI